MCRGKGTSFPEVRTSRWACQKGSDTAWAQDGLQVVLEKGASARAFYHFGHSPTPSPCMCRFVAILQLRGGDSSVSIVETNQFKHLSHISLTFRPGNDSAVKQYLAVRLAEFKVSPYFTQWEYHLELRQCGILQQDSCSPLQSQLQEADLFLPKIDC